jgi:phospho-N-acetylmuramoyl-pentapeptide-transferase
MIYWLYQHFGGHEAYIPGWNLLRYITFRTVMSLFTAQVVVMLMGSRFIRWMQAKQGKGQPIRTDGIERHVVEKAGTPTMGGFMMLAGLLVGTLLWADLTDVYVWMAIAITAVFGLLGFMDDYAKVTKQTTQGVSGTVRICLEFLISFAAVAAIIQWGPKGADGQGFSTDVVFPLFKSLHADLGWFYVVFGGLVIVGAANAVNFTDGLDGLATVPVMIAAAAYGVIAYLVGNFVFSNYLQLHFVPGVGEIAVFCGALIGSGLGFLWYNAPPAKIFMGDTGSLALGGAVGTVAVATRHEIVLGVIGGLFVAETLSVMIQVASFKLTGRRVFRMAPVHHHFEKLGWSESTVVIRFWIVAVMLALVGLATLKLR